MARCCERLEHGEQACVRDVASGPLSPACRRTHAPTQAQTRRVNDAFNELLRATGRRILFVPSSEKRLEEGTQGTTRTGDAARQDENDADPAKPAAFAGQSAFGVASISRAQRQNFLDPQVTFCEKRASVSTDTAAASTLCQKRFGSRTTLLIDKLSQTSHGSSLFVIVPFRERLRHLEEFLPRITNYFTAIFDRCLDFNWSIIIAQQHDTRPFNRGLLFNCSVVWIESAARKSRAMKPLEALFHESAEESREQEQAKPEDAGNSIYLCFHDVDIVPKGRHFDFSFESGVPCHYFRPLPGEVNHLYGHPWSLGGVFVLNLSDYRKATGFSNLFWGWGWEDVDFEHRCRCAGLKIKRDHFSERPASLCSSSPISRSALSSSATCKFAELDDPWDHFTSRNCDEKQGSQVLEQPCSASSLAKTSQPKVPAPFEARTRQELLCSRLQGQLETPESIKNKRLYLELKMLREGNFQKGSNVSAQLTRKNSNDDGTQGLIETSDSFEKKTKRRRQMECSISTVQQTSTLLKPRVADSGLQDVEVAMQRQILRARRQKSKPKCLGLLERSRNIIWLNVAPTMTFVKETDFT